MDFDVEVNKATKTVNNLNTGIVDAYKSFAEQSRTIVDEVLPATDLLTIGTDDLISSNNLLAASTKESTAALKEQFSVMQSLDLMRAGFASAVGGVVQQGSATLKPQLPGGESFRSAGELVSQFGGLIPGFNAKPGDPYFGFGKGDDLRSFKPAAAGSTSTTNVTINVNGTVIDPEGAARAVASVISNSAGRAGPVALNPVLAVQ
jgi:hypothetical protein